MSPAIPPEKLPVNVVAVTEPEPKLTVPVAVKSVNLPVLPLTVNPETRVVPTTVPPVITVPRTALPLTTAPDASVVKTPVVPVTAAVIAAAVAGLGLIEATDFGMAKTAKQAQEHRDYFINIIHPAFVRSNWLGPNYNNLEGQEPPEWIKKK